ncbi:hypothetical protein D3C72_2012860 [compost metagenome]
MASNAAFNTVVDKALHLGNLVRTSLVSAYQISDVITRIGVPTGLGLSFNPIFHGVRQGYIHRRHSGLLDRLKIPVDGKIFQIDYESRSSS